MIAVQFGSQIVLQFVHKGLYLWLVGELPRPEDYLEMFDRPLQKLEDVGPRPTLW